MRLNRLHIKGFKSFANDTIVNFNEDVIGIVGPNGSGKSNIVDAIRWVLGEQKGRELRLDKMSDVVFNGTKSRKESGVAQVSLTFDNTKNILPTEFNTVTISRLLYRSGESEYRLNDVPCRLKDIITLFLDTGIGSNSYAIIALGMVDDILANKENARRKMFEQAAGISKYKKRKKETLNKLKATQGDLERLEDIIFELDKNLKTLQKQAKRAERYLTIKEEYREKSLIGAAIQVQGLEIKRKDINEKLLGQNEAVTKLKNELRTAEANLEKDKSQNLNKEQELNNFQKDLNQLVNKNRDQEHQKNLLAEKVSFGQSRIKELRQRIKTNEEELKSFSTRINQLTELQEQQRKGLSQGQSELQEKTKIYDSINEKYIQAKTDFERFHKLRTQQEQDIFELDKQAAISNNAIDNLDKELGFIQARVAKEEEKLTGVHQQRDAIKKEVEALSESLAKLQSASKEQSEQKQKINEEIEQLRQSRSQVSRKLDAKSNERNLLHNMIENLEGYPDSMKYLKQKWSGKAPVLADIIDVDDSIKKSLEQFLDNHLNYYIVKNLAKANEAISLLKNAQKGKASFFLLDEIQNTKKAKSPDGRLQAVIDLIQFDSEYKNLVVHLLGNVFVFSGKLDELDSLNVPEGITILSLKGDFVKHGSAISGGSVGLFEGSRIGRKKYLKELNKDITKQEKKLNEILENIANNEALLSKLKEENLSDIIQETNVQLRKQENAQIKITTENQAFLNAIEQDKQKIIRIDGQKTELQKQQESVLKLKQQAQIKFEELLGSNNSNNQGLEQEAIQVNRLSQDINELKLKLLREENIAQNTAKDINYTAEREKDVTVQCTRDKEQTAKLDKENTEGVAQIKEIEEDLIKGYKAQKEHEAQLNDVERSYFKVRGRLLEQEENIRLQQKKINQSGQLLQEYRERLTNLGFERNAILDRLTMEFNIEAKEIKLPEIEDKQYDSNILDVVERLRRQMANFGEINPLALEAFKEMQERYDNMIEQRTDIMTAKDSLMETIDEIDETAKAKFVEAFDLVRGHFKRVFRSLFTEDDDCDLVLLNSESPLEAEIDIIAKPKGKKPKSLSQLSGGEKTLTATALLFSLYLLKPAPFCIFDEVDAPLDDANIQKFNKIIKEFSKESQFIIVTHNKLTMAEVDILYGVYMQEQGVSGISPVDFRKYKYEPTVVKSN